MELNPKRQCKCIEHTGRESWHETCYGYTRHGCRCHLCAKAAKEYRATDARKKISRESARRLYVPRIPDGSCVLCDKPLHNSRTSAIFCYDCKKDVIRRLIWESQNGLCTLCGEYVEFEKSVLDHDHDCCNTGAVNACGKCYRGVLHRPCNLVLGLAHDDIKFLSLAIEYLDNTCYWEAA